MNVSENGNTDHNRDICKHILTHAISVVLFMTFALCFRQCHYFWSSMYHNNSCATRIAGECAM